MKAALKRKTARPAFTLIELLMVIAIIGVLASLLTAGVVQIMRKGNITKNAHEINQLGLALEAFKQKFGFYPPSTITLNNAIGSMSATDQSYIRRMFPRITGTMTWGNATLQGDQCLVFFLGGLQDTGSPPGCLGFSTSPTNPCATGGTRIGPFYEFQSNRLGLRSGASHLSYQDTYGQWFAYLSSGSSPNGYNTTSDCSALGVSPYYEAAGTPARYHKPNSYQIISAGRDNAFGPGGSWTPATAGSITANGRDDQTNFYGSLMGAGE